MHTPLRIVAASPSRVCIIFLIIRWCISAGHILIRYIISRQGHTVESAVLTVRGLCTANTYDPHHCVCHATLFPFRAWTDGKTKDIINCLYIYFERWSSRLWKGVLHFRRVLAVFGQSQCTGSVGQSEQTALVRRRDFVENDTFERGGA